MKKGVKKEMRGGKRAGAGGPKLGRKTRCMRLTDGEYEGVRGLLGVMRGDGGVMGDGGVGGVRVVRDGVVYFVFARLPGMVNGEDFCLHEYGGLAGALAEFEAGRRMVR